MSNNENKTVVKKQGLGLGTVLTIIFVVLKLVGVIDWAWVWVLAPFWISVAISLVFSLIALLIVAIAAIVVGKD
jgi:hypothetical protein